MRDVIFTLYKNTKDVQGLLIKKSWSDWLEVFSRHDVRGHTSDTTDKARLDKAKDGPAVVLGEIPQGLPRRGSNVKAVHALALDIEEKTNKEVQDAIEKLQPFEYFIYTTHKHGSEVAGQRARLRLILPLERPISPAEHATAWRALNALTGGLNDPSTKDAGRLHFLPSTFDPDKAWTLHNESDKWISPADLPETDTTVRAESSTILTQEEAIQSVWYRFRVLPKAHQLKKAATALLKNEPFAPEGSRHNTMIGLTMFLAQKDKGLEPVILEKLFAESLKKMDAEAPGAPTMQEVVKAYQSAVDKIRKEKRDYQLRAAGINAGPYSKDDLQRIANKNNWTLEQLRDKWIVQRDGAAWFLTESGDYAGPYSKDDVTVAATKYLARAPVNLVVATQRGFKRRPFGELACEAGSLADSILSDLTLQRSFYDPEKRVMHEAILPLRTDLNPEYCKEIDEWLQLAGGPLYSKLVDWMSCCADLDKLLCGVYFDGPKGSGKTMFAFGLAKLWTEGPPAELEQAISGFNDELTRCPLILGDEEIPKRYNRQNVTTILRSMLSTTSRTLKRKYRPTSEVRGAIRLVLAANNEFLLDSKDVSTSQDLEAVAQRFLYVNVPQEAADYLDGISRKEKIEWWNRKLAGHALYLKNNHQIKTPGKRFWVEGDISQMHRLLMTGTKWNSLCCEWLVRYLMDPQKFDSQGNGLVRVEDGELLVNDQAVLDGWELYMKIKQEPETAKVGAALRAISKPERRQKRWQGIRIRFRVIDTEHLYSWSDRYNIGDREIMKARINGDLVEGENVIQLDRSNERVDFDEVFGGKEGETE